MGSKNEKFLKEFGKNLQKLREARGLSTRQFAYEAEISHSSVGRLEAGLSNPTLTTLIKIADALEVDLNRLGLRG
jgi:transcriptional regulator with XRE-family HTH domain